jgi:hypothetical protein
VIWVGQTSQCVSTHADLFHPDFNLDFYTEVQDLSYLHNLLSTSHPRFSALNEAICDLVEDFGLVAFETLAVEVSYAIPFSR